MELTLDFVVMVMAQLMSSTQTVAVIRNEANPASRFQVIAHGLEGSAKQPIFTCATQGDITAWLVRNGYRWVKDSHNPQFWAKSTVD